MILITHHDGNEVEVGDEVLRVRDNKPVTIKRIDRYGATTCILYDIDGVRAWTYVPSDLGLHTRIHP